MENLTREKLNSLSGAVLDAAIAVHKEMGPGLLESVYQHCMIYELRSKSIHVEGGVAVPLIYKSVALTKDYIIDILVENELILELKAIDKVMPIHEAQLLSYLKLTNRRLGLLINFNVPVLKQGFRRLVNKF
jgi:GxxExxY protein